ncbi:hypothetical protein C1646_684762, partial [Rhizophagus diaphanus]
MWYGIGGFVVFVMVLRYSNIVWYCGILILCTSIASIGIVVFNLFVLPRVEFDKYVFNVFFLM